MQKCPKSFPKVSKRVLNMFWGDFFRKFFFAHCSLEGRVVENFQKNQKLFKIAEKPKIVPKNVQTCFEHVLGYFFRKIFAQCSMEGRVFENFQKNRKFFKIAEKPNIVPKNVQTCFEHVLGYFFRKIFCPVFHGGSSLRKFSKKSKIFQNSKQTQNRSHNCPKFFWTYFGVIFSKVFLPSVLWKVELSIDLKKIKKLFKIPKKPTIVPKNVQTCFEHVLGRFFRKNFFAQCSMGVESSKIFKKIETF